MHGADCLVNSICKKKKKMLLVSIFIIGIQSIFKVLNNSGLKTRVKCLLPLSIENALTSKIYEPDHENMVLIT